LPSAPCSAASPARSSLRQGFVSPESFVFLESAIILAIVVLGGMGSQLGIAIAAIAIIGGVRTAA
jgi:branched-chain amino acid transport system permease protein